MTFVLLWGWGRGRRRQPKTRFPRLIPAEPWPLCTLAVLGGATTLALAPPRRRGASEGASAEAPSCWWPPEALGKEPQCQEEAEPLCPAAITRKRAPCFPKVAFALSSRWTPQKVTQNDLNASFPWCEGRSREPLNEGSAFFFFYVLRVFPLLLQFLQSSAVTGAGISLRLLSVHAAATGMARLLLTALEGLSQVWTLCLSRCRPRDWDLGSTRPWSIAETPTDICQGGGFILVLSGCVRLGVSSVLSRKPQEPNLIC